VDAPLTVRAVETAELTRLAEIDRAEDIDGHYVVDHGRLAYVAAPVVAPGWGPDQVEGYVARLREVVGVGGLVVGAWAGAGLVGLAALDVRPVGGDARTMELDFLHVDRAHRGRGVARRLVGVVGAEARARGATALYISATPTRNTVDAYLRLGAHLAAEPDPVLLAREPDDIHLLLTL
jgi:predicted N-acetyltransferase YhbS